MGKSLHFDAAWGELCDGLSQTQKTPRSGLESWPRIIQEELPEQEVKLPRNEGHER